MEIESSTSLGPKLATGAWWLVWNEIARLVAETRQALGSHLRDGELDCQIIESSAENVAAEITIGRSRLRLDCALVLRSAEPSETLLVELFGREAPLLRIHVWRERPFAGPVLESALIVEPTGGWWLAADANVGPARLDDALALERWVWGLLIDG